MGFPRYPRGMTKLSWVYILTNAGGTVLYTGVTTNLRERVEGTPEWAGRRIHQEGPCFETPLLRDVH